MGDKVYVCLKMSKKTLEVEATHQFEKSEIPYSLASDGTHLYAGMYSYPGKIAKISKQTMGLDKLLTLGACSRVMHASRAMPTKRTHKHQQLVRREMGRERSIIREEAKYLQKRLWL